MTEKYTHLDILPTNKTVVFYSPLEGEDVLVRTGTIGDGSCFFHSLLHGYSSDYVNMSTENRKNFVIRLRKSMASKMDKKTWEHMSNGLISKISFQEKLLQLLYKFFIFVQKYPVSSKPDIINKLVTDLLEDTNKNIIPEEINTFKIIFEILPFVECFEQDILPTTYSKTENKKIDFCIQTMRRNTLLCCKKRIIKLSNNLDSKRINFFLNKLDQLILLACKESYEISYNEYVNNLQNNSVDIDTSTIDMISDKFKRDVYFIDANTRLPYRNASTTANIKNRTSMIIIWINNAHYEIVGKLLPGNKIKRDFEHSDPLIKRINTFLLYPEKIPDEYPGLIPYLPIEIRNNVGISMSLKEIEEQLIKNYQLSDAEDDEKIDSESDN